MKTVVVVAVLSFALGVWVGRAWANKAFLYLIDKTFPPKKP